MSRMNRGKVIASTMLLVAVLLSSCEQPYSTPPAVTNTPLDPNSFFTTPIADAPDSMKDVENFTTQTALAGQPGAIVATATPVSGATATATPMVALNPTLTATQAVSVVPNAPPATAAAIPAGSSYTLQDGEYPYCIARRFNVNPDELLALNGLVDSQTVYAGKVLAIPKTGNPFPSSRMWHNHPDTYTVDSSSETIYGVACYYGDIDPSVIAQANNLPVNSSLTVGQKLQIP